MCRERFLMLVLAGLLAVHCGGDSGNGPTAPPSTGRVDAATFEVLSVSVPRGGTVRVGTPVVARVRGTATGGEVSIIGELQFFGGSRNTRETVNGPFEVNLSMTPTSPGPADGQGRVGHVSALNFGQGAVAERFFSYPYEMTVLDESGILEVIDIPVLPIVCNETRSRGEPIEATVQYSTGNATRRMRLRVLTANRVEPFGQLPPVPVPSTGERQRARASTTVTGFPNSTDTETAFIQALLIESNTAESVAQSPQYPCRIRWR